MPAITSSLLFTRTAIGFHSPVDRKETANVGVNDLSHTMQSTIDALENNGFNVTEVVLNNPDNEHTVGNSDVITIVAEPPANLSIALEPERVKLNIRNILVEEGLPVPHFYFNDGKVELNY